MLPNKLAEIVQGNSPILSLQGGEKCYCEGAARSLEREGNRLTCIWRVGPRWADITHALSSSILVRRGEVGARITDCLIALQKKLSFWSIKETVIISVGIFLWWKQNLTMVEGTLYSPLNLSCHTSVLPGSVMRVRADMPLPMTPSVWI